MERKGGKQILVEYLSLRRKKDAWSKVRREEPNINKSLMDLPT